MSQPSPVGPAGPTPAAPVMPFLEPRTRRVSRLVALGGLIAFCALATIGIVAFLGYRIGPVPLAVGLALAILPVPVLVGCFLWLDRYQPSPLWIIVACFLWGAGVATSVALLVNNGASAFFERHHISDDLVAVVVAPMIEETMKAALPLLLFFFYRRAFTGIIDGIVFCGISATGFAMVENILYLGRYGFGEASQHGYASGAFAAVSVFIGRVLFSGFAHPLFTSMTGLALGLAARSPRRWVRGVLPFAGLFAAMVLHATWNGMATLSQREPYFILYGYFAVFMPLFFTMVGLVLWVRSWEGRLAERVLPAYVVAGWFSPPEVTALGTLGRRLSARNWARRVAGAPGLAAMKSYQYAATRLALLRDGIDRGLYTRNLDSILVDERRLLEAVDAYRKAFVGRDPVAPRAWWAGTGYQIQFPDGVVRPVAAPPLPVVPVPFQLTPAGPPPPAHAPWVPPTPA